MTARTRRRRTNAGMAAWRKLDPGFGFVPVAWYAKRNPRRHQMPFIDGIGQVESFRSDTLRDEFGAFGVIRKPRWKP